MKHSVLALMLIGAAAARPTASLKKREVPQEHSHRNVINAVNTLLFQDNPDDIQDAIFGLLGAAAAAEGAGSIADAGMKVIVPSSMQNTDTSRLSSTSHG